MRAVVQRVSRAEVAVGNEITGKIGVGVLVLLGVAADDAESDAIYLAEKIATLRIFEDDDGKMNRSVSEAGGAVLASRNLRYMGTCAAAAVLPSMLPLRPNSLALCMNSLSIASAPPASCAKPAASRK